MKASRTKSPKPLATSLSTLLRQLGIDHKVKESLAIGQWPNWVGEKIATVTTAEKVIDGILFVKVKNSTWRNELIYMRGQILSKIEKEIGPGVIKEIRYI